MTMTVPTNIELGQIKQGIKDSSKNHDFYEIQKKFDEIKKNTTGTCPHCGRCPTCGRGGYSFPSYPNYPQYSPVGPIFCNDGVQY